MKSTKKKPMKAPSKQFPIMILSGFIPDGYEQPTGGGGYTKLEAGENRLRICSKPLLIWIVWENGKVTRSLYKGKDSKPAKPTSTPKDSVKHAWAVIAYNYKTKAIEVWEIDKASIISDLMAYIGNAEYGAPTGYDVTVTKKGSGMETEYKTIAGVPKDPSDEVMEAYGSTPVNLDNLLSGKDPFTGQSDSEASAPGKPAKTVTPENWVDGDAVPEGYEQVGQVIKKKGAAVKKPFGA